MQKEDKEQKDVQVYGIINKYCRGDYMSYQKFAIKNLLLLMLFSVLWTGINIYSLLMGFILNGAIAFGGYLTIEFIIITFIKEDLLDISQFNEFNEFFRRHDPKHEKEDEVFRKLSYVDIQNFADKITAKVHWTLAFKDENCHPSTQFATYNKIKSEKEMIIYPDYGHEPQLLFQDNDLFQFYLKNL